MTSDHDVAAIILAAGRGERLKLGPKAFVRLDGRTLLEQATAVLSEAGITEIVAVLPPSEDPDEIVSDLATLLPGFQTVRNPNPEHGMLSSVCLGLDALAARQSGRARRVLIYPVDHPWVEVTDVRRLIEEGMNAEAGVEPITRVVPTWGRKAGHPVLVLESGVSALHAVSDPTAVTLRDILSATGETHYIDASGPGVVRNLNTPADLETATEDLL